MNVCVDLDELERLANDATSGRWRLGVPHGQCFKKHKHGVGNCDYRVIGYLDSTAVSIDVELMSQSASAPIVVMPDEYNEGPSYADSAYIVAAQPSTMLSVIQRFRSLERQLADANAHIDELHGRLSGMLDEHDRLALNQAEEARHMRSG